MTSDIAAEAVHDLRQLTAVIRRLSGILESAVLTQRAAMEARRLLGIHYTSVAILESPQELIMRGSAGARTEEIRKLKVPRGAGVGGKVLVLRKPVSVADYEHDSSISRDFVDLAVHREGLRGVTGVPIEYEDQTLGVLYGGIRDVGYMGDRGRLLLMETARSLGPLVVAANQAEEGVRHRLQEDRQRLGLELHDNLGQLLFGIGASARRAREQISGEAQDLAAELKDIEAQASRAASCLRDALRALAPSSPEDALSAVMRLDASRFSSRTEIPVHFVVLGTPFDLASEVEKVLLALVREGLHNVEKHAAASSVILTLYYDNSKVDLAVQDDGNGLPANFELHPVPRAGYGWGLPSLSQRVESFGGRMELIPNEDGGVTLRASVPGVIMGR